MFNISRFHYITQDVPGYTNAQLAEKACTGGVRWVQFRMKGKPADEFLAAALEVKAVCDKHRATLIINDSVDITLKTGAAGVHLGKKDMPVAEARKILGNKLIIGGTANTFKDIENLAEAGANYIGLGPFRFTETKKNLSPVLGSEGYGKILNQCVKAGINIPIVAIGGIKAEDITLLLSAGVYGVAVSSAINIA